MLRFSRLFLFLYCVLIATTVHAQFETRVYWDPDPKIHDIPDSFKKYSAVAILDQRKIYYKSEGEETYIYRTFHKLVKLLDDKGVEGFNTWEVNVYKGREIKRLMARTITKEGKVYEIPEDKISIVKNENGAPIYKVAMEGVSKGSEVEFLYEDKRPVSLFGSEPVQSGIPTLRSEFTLIANKSLRFEFKEYNGASKVKDTLLDGKHFYYSVTTNIPPLEDETYSYYASNLKSIAFRLSFIEGTGGATRLNTWDNLAKELYKVYYVRSSKEEKVIKKFLEKIGVQESDPELTKIMKIEDGVKKEISMSNEINTDDENYLKFDKIFEKKLTTEKGMVRLMTACMDVAGVSFELGLTSDYTEQAVDKDFEDYSILDHFVMYFPRTQKFLVPAYTGYRYPILPTQLLNNNGVFVRRSTIGNVSSVYAEIVKIKAVSYEESSTDIKAVVKFDKNLVPVVDYTHYFNGYSALGLREAFTYVEKDKEKDLAKELLQLAEKTEDIDRYEVKNVDYANYTAGKPLTVSGTMKAPQLMEKAGNRYLFKIGDIIGRQEQLYAEKPRVQDVDMPFPHELKRDIVIEIPQGYKVKNPESVKIDITYKNSKDKDICGFISGYKQEGNLFTVTINEYYKVQHVPRKDYESFRKVINAAADFNKVVLILEKS